MGWWLEVIPEVLRYIIPILKIHFIWIDFSNKRCMQEDILFYLAMNNHVKMFYDPQLKVKHIEDATSKSISNTNKDKRIFELKNSLQSLLILKKLMKKG